MITVLVVDDSMLIRHVVCRWLEERGFDVESASNGLEALNRIFEKAPDVIITDLQMPSMSGGALISVIKAHPTTARIPVVVLASKQSESQSACPPGVHLRIYKDIEIEAQLERAIEQALAQRV